MAELISLGEAAEILAARGMPIDRKWLTAKASAGKIEGAVKIAGRWIVPREWAETYVKVKMGRPRTVK